MLISNAIYQIGAMAEIVYLILKSLSDNRATFSLLDGLPVTYNCDVFSM